MNIRTENFNIQDGEIQMDAFVARPEGSTSRPAVLVAHTWGGRGDFENNVCRKLAELGYVGVAVDLYGKGVRGDNPEVNAQLMQPFLDDRELLQRRMLLSLAAAREMPGVDSNRIAAIGYCFGGIAVLDLARKGADVAGVVSFHGMFHPPGNTQGTKIKSKVLALHGWDDPLARPADFKALADELTEAQADWQLHAYGNTLHAFTIPSANDPEHGAMYSVIADKRSWAAMVSFLEEVFTAH